MQVAPTVARATPALSPTSKRSKPDDAYINQVLNNRFKVESKIGEGGFGAVYRGVQLATGRKVALKLLHPEMKQDGNLVARFRREGMVLCNLRDAHTITTYDFDQTADGTLYIAMELLEGQSLHQVFKSQAPLEWRRTFKILTEICSSLAEAHSQGIVHRDLKPENIYLENRPGNPEFVKVLDFGIAKVVRGESGQQHGAQLTATGQTLGTLEYMSPEQLMGKQLDGRSDVYALGVVAYEMVTGRLPFPDAKGPAALITAQLRQSPVPPSVACTRAVLPAIVDQVILKALEKDPANRFAHVSVLATNLQDAIDRDRVSSQNSAVAAMSPALPQVQTGAPPLADDADERATISITATPYPVGQQRPYKQPTPYPVAQPQPTVQATPYPVGQSSPPRQPAPHPASQPSLPKQGTPYPVGQANPAKQATPYPVSQPPVTVQATPYSNAQAALMAEPTVARAPAVKANRLIPRNWPVWVWWAMGLFAGGAVAAVAIALVLYFR